MSCIRPCFYPFPENKDQFDSTSTAESALAEGESSSKPPGDAFPVVVGPRKTKRPASQGVFRYRLVFTNWVGTF